MYNSSLGRELLNVDRPGNYYHLYLHLILLFVLHSYSFLSLWSFISVYSSRFQQHRLHEIITIITEIMIMIIIIIIIIIILIIIIK